MRNKSWMCVERCGICSDVTEDGVEVGGQEDKQTMRDEIETETTIIYSSVCRVSRFEAKGWGRVKAEAWKWAKSG